MSQFFIINNSNKNNNLLDVYLDSLYISSIEPFSWGNSETCSICLYKTNVMRV
jgi:hypothetical protein